MEWWCFPSLSVRVIMFVSMSFLSGFFSVETFDLSFWEGRFDLFAVQFIYIVFLP